MNRYVRLNIERPEKAFVKEFMDYDVSTVYEAQGKIGLLNYDLRPIIEGSFICGPAVTVTCMAGDNLMIHAAIEAVQPGDILVVSTIGESHHGMIGELIVRALIEKGVQGVIIDAGIRDVKQLRKLGFPVWSKAIYSQGTTKNRGGWVNAPCVCGGVQVNPGDLIMADDDGVVRIKSVNIEAVLELTKKRVEREKVVKSKIKNGELSIDFYNLRPILEKEEVVYIDSFNVNV